MHPPSCHHNNFLGTWLHADKPVPAPRVNLQAVSPPANDLSTVSERTGSLELELSFGENTEDFASDHEDKTGLHVDVNSNDDDDSGSINFESSISLPISPKSSAIVTPPFEFSGGMITPGKKWS